MGYKTIELGNYTKPFSPQLTKIYDDLRFNTWLAAPVWRSFDGRWTT